LATSCKNRSFSRRQKNFLDKKVALATAGKALRPGCDRLVARIERPRADWHRI
jgi:hypothetical protein